ncbi:MAG: DNA gyrase inhibitor YacG [Pedobacter sp.]
MRLQGMTNNLKSLTLKCPRCGATTHWENNAHRPFCSRRCLQIDLGAWVDEEYRVPVDDSQPKDDFDL